jgi:F-type H+-transporting ATPase subunit b
MHDAGSMNATTEQPAPHKATGGFPPFDATTFPSQIFWLVVSFAFLFIVMWRVAGPRISGVITTRRDKINGDIAAAQKNRNDAEAASAAYQTALAGARARAQSLADENRKRISDEMAKARAGADAQAHEATVKAEARIQATRAEARESVAKAAQDVAIAIVAHLTGDTVSQDEAAAAVKSTSGG